MCDNVRLSLTNMCVFIHRAVMNPFSLFFLFFFKSNWKHNAAVGWTHRSSSVSVITPNNVQSCQAPLSLSLCLSPLKPSQISFVWMCNYFVAQRKKEKKKQLASCNLLPRWRQRASESGVCVGSLHCRQTSTNTLALCCGLFSPHPPPPRRYMWDSSASGNKRQVVKNASAR